MSARTFAAHILVPHNAVTAIMKGERSVTAQRAIRLGQAFGTTAQYWMNVQSIYDLKRARAEMPADALRIEPLRGSLNKGRDVRDAHTILVRVAVTPPAIAIGVLPAWSRFLQDFPPGRR